MKDWRVRIAIAGSLGLLTNAGLMVLVAILQQRDEGAGWLLALLERGMALNPAAQHTATLVVYVLFLGLAVAEIPVMTIGLRAMMVSRTRSLWLIVGVTAFFVFFAAVYGAALTLLVGRLDLGLSIAGTGILRLLAVGLGVLSVRPAIGGPPA